jgi:hypothetical protein
LITTSCGRHGSVGQLDGQDTADRVVLLDHLVVAGLEILGVVRYVREQRHARQDADIAGHDEDVGIVEAALAEPVELVPDADVRGAEAVLQADVDDVIVLELGREVVLALVAGAEGEAAEAEQRRPPMTSARR